MSHTLATRQKVLVADDDRTTRHAITRMLRDANYAVTAATDGIDALRKIQGIAGPGKTISGTASVLTPPASKTLSSPIEAAAE